MEEDNEPVANEGESVFRLFNKNEDGSYEDYYKYNEQLQWNNVQYEMKKNPKQFFNFGFFPLNPS